MGRYVSPETTRITDGEQAGVVPQDEYTESLITMGATQSQINRGVAFFTNYHSSLGLNATFDILQITADNALIVSIVDLITSTLETQLDVYLDTTFTDNGTPLIIANRNGRSINTSTVTAFHSPVIDVLGTSVYTTRWGTGNKVGSIKEGLGAILAPDQGYHYRLTSRAPSNYVTHELYWTEDINRNP